MDGSAHWGFIDHRELKLNERGEHVLYKYIKGLESALERLKLRRIGVPLKSERNQ